MRTLALGRDGIILFVTRYLRLFGFGLISVSLPFYLAALGYDAGQVGLMMSLTLVGDMVISLLITTQADRIGRRLMLVIGGGLIVLAGITFILTGNFVLLVLAAIFGIMSPSGNEVGPFLPIEQSALAHILPESSRTKVFAWYNMAGSFATALGALIAGWAAMALQAWGLDPVRSYQVLIGFYALTGVVQIILFFQLSKSVEVKDSLPARVPRGTKQKLAERLGIPQSAKTVYTLSALFSMDAFGGGFVVSGIVSFWFFTRYGIDSGLLGSIIFGANILAGVSALLAVPLAKRFGLINTMVFTHLPSNVFLILVPLMPNLPLAIAMLLLRFSISQMDVPTRQAYVMNVVPPQERSAAAGITGIARSIGASISPGLAGLMIASSSLIGLPFFLSGGIKIVYDLLLFRRFSMTQKK